MVTYYRLAVGQIPVSRVLYLDCDIIVRKDIRELFNTDLRGKIIGAVPDVTPAKNFSTWLEMPNIKYFNAGMLVIDVDLWRKNGIEIKLLRFLRENSQKVVFLDQDALNAILWDYCEIGSKYNFIPLFSDGIPSIVHFASGKPWFFLSDLPYRAEYIYYINKTSWKNKKFRRFGVGYLARKCRIEPLALPVRNLYKKFKKAMREWK